MNSSCIEQCKYILTFGYGNRKNYDELLTYLQKFNVKCFVDVLISPRAWRRKWYADKINEFFCSNNIEYLSKPPLGNTSGKENWIPPDQDNAEIALREVAEIAQTGTVLLLCAEMDHHRCHRTDVANCLSKLVNTSVIHLE